MKSNGHHAWMLVGETKVRAFIDDGEDSVAIDVQVECVFCKRRVDLSSEYARKLPDVECPRGDLGWTFVGEVRS